MLYNEKTCQWKPKERREDTVPVSKRGCQNSYI